MLVGNYAYICSKIDFGLYFDKYGLPAIESNYTEATLSLNFCCLSDRYKIQKLTFNKFGIILVEFAELRYHHVFVQNVL